MKSPVLLSRLIELEAKIDPVLFAKRWDPETGTMVDDDAPSAAAKLAGAGVVAGGLGVGGYYGNRAVQAAGGYKKVAGAGIDSAGRTLAGGITGAKAGFAGAQTGLRTVASNVERYADPLTAKFASPSSTSSLLQSAKNTTTGATGEGFFKGAVRAGRNAAETGGSAAKKGALDVVAMLKKKLPRLVPHLSRIGLAEEFHGKLIELAERTDEKRKRYTGEGALAGAAIGAGVGAAATPAYLKATNRMVKAVGMRVTPGMLVPREHKVFRKILAGSSRVNRKIMRGGWKGRSIAAASAIPGSLASGALVGHFIKKKNNDIR